ncbi:MAG: reductive dehalogenase [Planctomycetota bacterium]
MDAFLDTPYQVDPEAYKRFEEKYTCFARVRWDTEFKGYGKPIQGGAPAKAGRDHPGYSRIGYAMQGAAWTVYATYPGGFSHSRVCWPGREKDADVPESDPFNEALGPLKVDDPAHMAAVVKRAAQVYGSAATGIAKINPHWIYSHKISGEPLELPEGVKYAVVMLIEMDAWGIDGSPALPAAVATGSGYSRMSFAAACLSEFIRNLGYRAMASGNDMGISVPLAIDAGLGEFGRNGMLIHPQYGQRVRICKVFTDLPLAADSPISFGAKRFCMTCMKCAQHCPSKSISFDREPTWTSPTGTPSNNPGVRKWYVNVDTCYAYWTANTADCSNCIRTCPYTKNLGWIHAIPRFFIHHFPVTNRLWLMADNLFGYGRQKDPESFFRRRIYLGRKGY